MKFNKNRILSLTLTIGFFLCVLFSQAQIPKDIITGLENGNAKLLAGYFNKNVELVILENDNLYSKAQAQQIVGNFFKDHTPEEKGFSVIHSGGKEGNKYFIGTLKTNKGNFRVTFLLKTSNKKDYIHQLRIENQ